MKKLLLSTTFIFCGIVAFTQTSMNLNQPSPNIAKTAYLTNLTGKVMQAYPNPATDQVRIQHVSFNERAVLSIISMDGKVLQQRTVLPNSLQTDLDIGMLKTGVYILRYDNNHGDVRTLQLVKH